MRSSRAVAGWLACLGAWAGCSFGPPRGTSDAATADAADDAAPDAEVPPDAYVHRCLTDPAYVAASSGRRYRRLDPTSDYDTSIDRCADDGAHLAVVDSMAENDHLRTLANNDVWIGFDDLSVETAFRWVTGSGATFTRWTGSEPNDNGIEDCTYLRPDGTWNDSKCEESRHAICECDPAYRPPPKRDCRTATEGFAVRMGRRYFTRTTARTWEQAQDDCASIGAHLISISDADENGLLDNLLSGATWLGYTDTAMEGMFSWVNGSLAAFNRWPGGTVPTDDDADCALLQDSGAWLNVSCGETHPYACECDPLPP